MARWISRQRRLALPALVLMTFLSSLPASAAMTPTGEVRSGAPCSSYSYEARIGTTLYTCRPQGKSRVWARVGTTKLMSPERFSNLIVPAISISQFGLSAKEVPGTYIGAMATSKTVTTFVWVTKPLPRGAVAEPLIRARYESLRAMLANKGWSPVGLLRRPDNGDPISFDSGAVYEKSEFSLTEGFTKAGRSLVLFVVGSDSDRIGFQNEVRIAFGSTIEISKYQPSPAVTSIIPPRSRLLGLTCEGPDASGITRISAEYELSGGSYEVLGPIKRESRYNGPTVRERAVFSSTDSPRGESVRLVFGDTMAIGFFFDEKMTQLNFDYSPSVSRSMCP